MGQLLSEILNDISDGRERRAMKTMFDKLLNNDPTATHKAIVFGAAATPISIAGAFTTGISISADGTTAINVTSGFSGVDMIVLAGSATDNGIEISGTCTEAAIDIQGTQTAAGLLISGTTADGIIITGNCSDSGIELTGVCTDDGILIDYVLPNAGARALNVDVETAVAADTNWAVNLAHKTTAGGASIGTLYTTLTMGGNHGSYAIGQFTQLNYTADGHTAVGGMGVAGMFEIILPNAAAGGEYHVLSLEFAEAGTSYESASALGSPTSFINFETYGAGATEIDDLAYLFHINGLTAATDKLLSLTSQTLRLDVEEAARYMVLSQMQDGLGLGNSITDMDLVNSTDHAIEVYTFCDDNDGSSVQPIYMRSELGAGCVGGRAYFHTYTEATELGGWVNAVKGQLEWATSGPTAGCTGLGSAVNAELIPPNLDLTSLRGSYFCYEGNIVLGDTFDVVGTYGINNAGFFWLRASGTLTNFEDTGWFMNVVGLTGAATNLLSLTSQTLKCAFETDIRYMVFSQTENALTIGASGDLVACIDNTPSIGTYNSLPTIAAGWMIPMWSETVIAAGADLTGTVQCFPIHGYLRWAGAGTFKAAGAGSNAAVAGLYAADAGGAVDITTGNHAGMIAALSLGADFEIDFPGHVAALMLGTGINAGVDAEAHCTSGIRMFPTVTDPVYAAIQIQQNFATYFLDLMLADNMVTAVAATAGCTVNTVSIKIRVDATDYYLLATTTPA